MEREEIVTRRWQYCIHRSLPIKKTNKINKTFYKVMNKILIYKNSMYFYISTIKRNLILKGYNLFVRNLKEYWKLQNIIEKNWARSK